MTTKNDSNLDAATTATNKIKIKINLKPEQLKAIVSESSLAPSRKASTNKIETINTLAGCVDDQSYSMRRLSSKLFNHFNMNNKDENECDNEEYDDEDIETNIQFSFEYDNDDDSIDVKSLKGEIEDNNGGGGGGRTFSNNGFSESLSSITHAYSYSGGNVKMRNSQEEKY
jgi:hypothetical protein